MGGGKGCEVMGGGKESSKERRVGKGLRERFVRMQEERRMV